MLPLLLPSITSRSLLLSLSLPADIMKLKQMIHDKKCGKVAKKCPPPAPKCQVVYKTVNKTVTKTVQPKQECKPTKQAKCGKQGC